MVGYASPGYMLPKKLKDALVERRTELKPTGGIKACPDCSAVGYAQHPHITVHQRGFSYPDTNTKAPRITIRHLWFNRS